MTELQNLADEHGEETQALLRKEEEEESIGLRNRASNSNEARERIPQGRAVALKMFAALAEAEKITGVPAVLPEDAPGSTNWVRAENYWRERHKNKTKQTIKNKVEAVCWLVAAAAVLNATDFFHVMWRDPRIDRFFLHIGLAGTGVIILMMVYLILYLGLWLGKGSTSPYADRINAAIVAGSISLVTCMISFPVAFWPVWTWWTIPILVVLHMGGLMSLHFVPTF